MKIILPVVMLMMLAFVSCTEEEKVVENPFFSEFNTPFQVPPFDLIDTMHYIPAFEKGMESQNVIIQEILSNEEIPNFENTILAYDKSDRALNKVSRVFYSLNSANTSPAMQRIAREVAPMLTQHNDNISMNDKLFQKIKHVYQNIDSLKLDDLQKRTTEKYYKEFVRSGADLNATDKDKLKEINQLLSKYKLQFGENLLAETNTNFKLVIDNEKELAGLPQGVIDAAAEKATELEMEGKWIFTLQKPSLLPFLQYADNRDLREKLYRGYFMRGNNNDKFDNKEIFLNIAKLRVERAKLLGYDNYAEYIIEKNMARNPDNVYNFLNQLLEPAMEIAKKDLAEMQKIVDAEEGNFKLQSWDWWYYTEKVRKQKFNLEESELQPYFKLENVRDGMFYVANKLFGLNFTKLPDMPVYHEEVEVFEVKDEMDNHVAVLYLDYHPRDGKRVGAWCGRLRSQDYVDGKKIYPIVTITTNFTRPTGDLPALLTWDEVITLFHEFGHALHGFYSDGPYSKIAGRIPRDMVELPSQVMEHWASQTEVLKVYAKHYETGEVIPQELMEKLDATSKFNQAFQTAEYAAAAFLDLEWHTLTESNDIDVLDFEKNSMKKINLIPEILPRYRTSYFSHVVGGYVAGYYVYDWAGVLDTDAFQYFLETGDIFNKEVAEKFKKHILAEGGNDEGMVQYKKFRGKEPSIEPLLKLRGLK